MKGMNSTDSTESMPVIAGATYREKATGLPWELAGLRSKCRVCMIHDAGGPNRKVLDYLPVDQLGELFAHESCDHDQHCCTLHGTHSMPHRGCLLR